MSFQNSNKEASRIYEAIIQEETPSVQNAGQCGMQNAKCKMPNAECRNEKPRRG
jgi:hypothetical protein